MIRNVFYVDDLTTAAHSIKDAQSSIKLISNDLLEVDPF